ncbi:MAG: TonB-dependent receptor [Phenylobacterium sp.]
MMSVTKLSLLAGAAFAALVSPVVSHAADAPQSGASTVQEIIVTANKREENLRDVPQSVTAISGESLERMRAATFEDYVGRVPGMALVGSQPGSSRLAIRGINAGGVSATIGTYVDETPYGSVTGLANGAVLAPDLDTFDMQRVEILRGPQGTLYGASSLGGVLKFVTNAPDPSRLAARVEVGGESTKSGSTSGSVKGVFNAPLGDKAAVRVSGYYSDQSGFIDDPTRDAKNVNEAKYSGVRASLLFQPTDNFTLRASAVGQEISSKGSSEEDVDQITLEPVYGERAQSRLFAQPSDVSYRIYNLTADYDLGFANLVSATSYATLQLDRNEDGTALLGDLLSSIFGQPLGVGLLVDLHQKKFTQEVRLASPAQQFEWLVGGFYTHEENRLLQNLSGLNVQNPPQVATGFQDLQTVSLPSDYSEYAAFANVDYHFTDRFDVSVGGRYSHNKQSALQTNGGLLSGPGSSFGGTSSEDVFTFAVAPKYKLSENATVYARAAKGYRPGGPNAVSPLAPAAVPRTFASDTIINYEAGLKADLLDRTMAVELTAFFIKWSDIQLLANVDNFGVNTNGGRAESKGVEGSVTYVPTQGLTLSANGAYTQANLTEDTPDLLGGKDGQRLPYSPLFAGSLNADYTRPVLDDASLVLGASLRFTGRRRSDFDPDFGQTSVPSLTTFDVRAGLDWGNYRVQAYVKNLFDEGGYLSLGGGAASPTGVLQGGLIRPRTIGLSLSASY